MALRKAVLAVVAILAGMSSASADDALKLGVTPSIGTGIAYVAKREGMFKKHGLDVELIVGNGAVLISGVVSQSMDIALPTITNFLQAVDSGLPLSAIAGGNILDDPTESRICLKNGTKLDKPSDFIGKTVGVSSIGATLHVLFQQWLINGSVNPAKVRFVEVPFPVMADVIRQGTVDAVVTTEPFGSRITSAGAGVAGPDFTSTLPERLPILLFVASNGWIAKNADVISRFKAALTDAVSFIETDPKGAKAASNEYLKMPEGVFATITLPKYSAAVDPKQIDVWINMMVAMDLLKDMPPASTLVK